MEERLRCWGSEIAGPWSQGKFTAVRAIGLGLIAVPRWQAVLQHLKGIKLLLAWVSQKALMGSKPEPGESFLVVILQTM